MKNFEMTGYPTLPEGIVNEQYMKIKNKPFKYPIDMVKEFCKHYKLDYDFVECTCVKSPEDFEFDWNLDCVYVYGGCYSITDYTNDEVVNIEVNMDEGKIFKNGIFCKDIEMFKCDKCLLDFSDYPNYLFLKDYAEENPLLEQLKRDLKE